ncbi:MAG: zinc-dependent dehydrogenase [Dehalococcoidales bacterium]|nr:zinc-dependent dehydrogenase [Dehalococcoidales bacterium]
MRVAMWYSNNDVRIEEIETPRIGPGELLVKIEASGICGSDVMEWYRLDRAPLVLGHEIGGQVVEAGEGVTRYRAGDRVTVAHHVPCNTCRYCLQGNHTVCDTLKSTNFDPGGFSEYVRVPEINVDRGVFLLPDEVSYEMATFVEPLACVLRGQRKAGLEPGQSILVIGSGIAGLLHVALARATGAGRIIATDVVTYRLEPAGKIGADHTFLAADYTPAKLREVNQGCLADIVIVCTGALGAYSQAIESAEPGGTILVFAPTAPGVTIPLSVNDFFWRRETTITTSYAGSPADHESALELIRAGNLPLEELITHRLPLSETGAGFKLVNEARDSIKVIIEPWKD